MQYVFSEKKQYRLAQITDCHLLQSADEYYHQVLPAQHLAAIVSQLLTEQPDAVILTGDLTQDHTGASYRLLAELMQPLQCPVFMTPGNHDDIAMLSRLSASPPFRSEQSLQLNGWQLLLLNTKGVTPAGVFSAAQQQWLVQQCNNSVQGNLWLFCHHHPLPLNCFIDKHGQQDQAALWQSITAQPRIRGIAHGHAHYAYQRVAHGVNVVGCPASSVQFLATPDWQTVDNGPQWCDWFFSADGDVSWQFRRL
ncbi:MAG TPA: metallophosphoesterase [Rheinheimera sp.]|nr:metallophosphoesterase [Rheinheimera sp.]